MKKHQIWKNVILQAPVLQLWEKVKDHGLRYY